ncbi:MAG: bifunctional riboflavin kinase/FAD synthetase [Sphingobacteriales bacterium]|nr:MAG: bifunctional riboflavin kinase/FAD synthetase [Sphingobacteriales bacterium]
MAVFFDINNLPAFTKAAITIGTFDGVHHGHKAILKQLVDHAKETGGESILLTFEPHPRKLLFPDQSLRLLTSLADKIELIEQEGVQHIVVVPFTKDFAALSSEAYIQDFLVKKFHPESIIIGYDHRFGHDRKGGIDMLKEYADTLGYKVFEISAQLIEEAAVSSTKIRKALHDGHVEEAAKMLDRPYGLKGKVVKGAQIGRTIGFPTANIDPLSDDQIVPANGVYAVKVWVDGISHNAMLNIGIRPTVSNDMMLHIEAHLLHFNDDLYGKTVTVEFVARLRDEQKFPSLDALKEQLQKDKEQTLTLLG